MIKVVKIHVLNAAGQPMAGQSVSLTGCGGLVTGPDGTVQFLADDVPDAVIQIAGAKVWAGSTEELKPNENFKQAGAGFARS